MESFNIQNLSFCYPDKPNNTLDNISFKVNKGEFVLICGKSGCGKTTLLRLLKSTLSPYGTLSGNIIFDGKNLMEYDAKEQAAKIGFVMQNPDNQIVTDKVWHELAFGLESLGMTQNQIRLRVSEMASFFGIHKWFYQKVTQLSGGQKQLLNLASVMVMQPSVLILDEPTSQLDPISAGEFLKTLQKINRELGTTIILTEHRLEEAFPLADRVIVMDDGKIIADETPHIVGKILGDLKHDMCSALPTAIKVHSSVKSSLPCPVTVRDGRIWLEEFSMQNTLNNDLIPTDNAPLNDDVVIQVKDAYFRYEKNLKDVVKDFSLSVIKGELLCLVGCNGTGKTTALSLISGFNKPYRGSVQINGQNISEIKNLFSGILGVLPQNPQTLFVKKTVYLDLMEVLSVNEFSKEQKEQMVADISDLCQIEKVLKSHPYDLSGGEQQRVALAKILLTKPQILLLDEPTKGMDAHFKQQFADILMDLKSNGVTIVMVSHDIEFCAQYSDRCALFFDGGITSVDTPREFFKGKSFYTTSANRMARTILPDAVLANDIIVACGGNVPKRKIKVQKPIIVNQQIEEKKEQKSNKKLSPLKIVTGSIFTLLFALTLYYCFNDVNIFKGFIPDSVQVILLQILSVIEASIVCFCFVPYKSMGVEILQTTNKQTLTKRTLTATLLILIIVPLTIFVGVWLFKSRKYYFISLLIILETLVPFAMLFEMRKPKARELVIISVLCALAVAGRTAFFMLPQFKPVVALVIIVGVCLGGETGFLVGAVTGFVSNFFFGQGPWTPWQMFAFGIIGFISGIIFKKRVLPKTKLSMCIYGFFATFVIYGGIMNPSSIIMWQNKINLKMIASACITGMPVDFVHALSTAFFIWFLSEPMIEKIERIKVKYGIIAT